jgi:hypothetical protein
MRLTWTIASALAVLLVACQPTRAPAPSQAPAGAPAPAAPAAADQSASSSPHSPEVLRLHQAARDAGETELSVSWSGSSLGGFDGVIRFEALFNQMYGTNIKVNFTPGPSMTDMAGKVAQEVAAGRKTSTDILLGSEQHYGSLLGRDVLEEYDHPLLQPRITKDLVAARNMAVEFYSTIPENAANVGFLHLGVPRNSSHPNLGKLFINMIVTEQGQRLLYDVYFVDHYALPGSQTGAELQELKARGLQVLDVDVQFVAEHPEMRELTTDLERLLREGRGG